MQQYILAIDSGTTSNRAILFNHAGAICGIAQQEFSQIYPKPGWVEHNPEEIWESTIGVVKSVLKQQNIEAKQIAGIGITNQRETTIVWNRETGKPIYNAIVWQDRRTATICDQLKANNLEQLFTNKTGLLLDAYFSGPKIQWILDNVSDARELAKSGKLAFGTVDSWIIWNLTGGKLHITDATNASRTLLFNIHTLQWDNELINILNIPPSVLPEVRESSQIYGKTDKRILNYEIPISGIAGDQQAALFGQMCIKEGMVKNTYGTGCFVMMNTGNKIIASKHNLLTTIAWQMNSKVIYAIEGSIFIAGAAVQWLRDNLNIIQSSAEIEAFANQVKTSEGVVFVPGFAGLGAPHWDQYATGMLIGLSRGSTRAHIARATLEAIALQTKDVVDLMTGESGIDVNELRVDGGAAINNLLMQIQADILQTPVVRHAITETTALGAAYLAGLGTGFWQSVDELNAQWVEEKRFIPTSETQMLTPLFNNWKKAIEKSKGWY